MPAEQCGEDVANYDFEIKQTKDCELIQKQDLSDRNCQRLKVEASYTNPLSKGAGSSTFFPGYIRTQNYAEKGDANAGQPNETTSQLTLTYLYLKYSPSKGHESKFWT